MSTVNPSPTVFSVNQSTSINNRTPQDAQQLKGCTKLVPNTLLSAVDSGAAPAPVDEDNDMEVDAASLEPHG